MSYYCPLIAKQKDNAGMEEGDRGKLLGLGGGRGKKKEKSMMIALY